MRKAWRMRRGQGSSEENTGVEAMCRGRVRGGESPANNKQKSKRNFCVSAFGRFVCRRCLLPRPAPSDPAAPRPRHFSSEASLPDWPAGGPPARVGATDPHSPTENARRCQPAPSVAMRRAFVLLAAAVAAAAAPVNDGPHKTSPLATMQVRVIGSAVNDTRAFATLVDDALALAVGWLSVDDLRRVQVVDIVPCAFPVPAGALPPHPGKTAKNKRPAAPPPPSPRRQTRRLLQDMPPSPQPSFAVSFW